MLTSMHVGGCVEIFRVGGNLCLSVLQAGTKVAASLSPNLLMIDPELAWYCVHTKPKCEHTASSMLRDLGPEIETYCPRIRFQRSTTRGKVWFVEALFPSYFFARFDASTWLRAVKHSQNVIRVVEFGGIPISISDETIRRLKSEMSEAEVREVKIGIKVGDTVEVTEGPMRGLVGIVERVHSGEERVRILLDFLGHQSALDVNASKVISETAGRALVATSLGMQSMPSDARRG